MRATIVAGIAAAVLMLVGCEDTVRTRTNSVNQFNAEYQRVNTVGYQIHAGDVLDITFFYTPEYNSSAVPVRPDGKIQLPLVGEFPIAGMTPAQAGTELKKLYSSQLKNPDLAVVVRTFGANTVLVQGEVRNPAELPIPGGATVLQAIGRAGSFLPTADISKVTVVRHSTGGTPLVVVLDLRQVLQGGNPGLDVPLLPGDVVYVPTLTGKAPAFDLFGKTPAAPAPVPAPQ
jgi:polysaccharide export outer membrane protein